MSLQRKATIQALEAVLDSMTMPPKGGVMVVKAWENLRDELDKRLQRLIAVDFYHSPAAAKPVRAKLRRA